MRIPLKNGTEFEIPPTWEEEWNRMYYDVPRTLAKARIWCVDNPSRRKTKAGLRAFLGRWIRKDCVARPLPQEAKQVQLPVQVEAAPLEVGRKHLENLKAILR